MEALKARDPEAEREALIRDVEERMPAEYLKLLDLFHMRFAQKREVKIVVSHEGSGDAYKGLYPG